MPARDGHQPRGGAGDGRRSAARPGCRTRRAGRARSGQVDRRAAGGAGLGRAGSGVGHEQGVLALEEPVAADPAGAAALAGVLR